MISNKKNVVITAGVRTAVGTLGGSLKNIKSHIYEIQKSLWGHDTRSTELEIYTPLGVYILIFIKMAFGTYSLSS